MAEILHHFVWEGLSPHPWMLRLQLLKSRKNKQFWMSEILYHLGYQPNFEIMGVAGIMHDMAGGAGFQPSTVSWKKKIF